MREVLRIDVPTFTEARLVEASLNELIPAEYSVKCTDLAQVEHWLRRATTVTDVAALFE